MKENNKIGKSQAKVQEPFQQKVQQRYCNELAKYQEQIRKTKELTNKDRAA